MSEDVKHLLERVRYSQDIFEKARILKHLKHDREVPVNEIATYLEIQPAYVSHYLRLNKLPEIVIDGYYSKLVSSTHLFIIARLPDFETMLRVYERVLAESLTSAKTEELVREELHGTKTEGEKIPKNEFERFRRVMEREFPGLEITLVQTRIKSKLVMEAKGSMEKTSKVMRRLQGKLAA